MHKYLNTCTYLIMNRVENKPPFFTTTITMKKLMKLFQIRIYTHRYGSNGLIDFVGTNLGLILIHLQTLEIFVSSSYRQLVRFMKSL